MSFSTNPEIIQVADSPCRTIDPHKMKACKREIDFDDDSGNSSYNDLPNIETILKKDNVVDVCILVYQVTHVQEQK